MNIGTWELIAILGSFAIVLGLFGLTIWGFVRVIRAGQTGWAIAIAVGFLFGVSWLVAIVYLLSNRRTEVRVE